jgi:hypothetical protein
MAYKNKNFIFILEFWKLEVWNEGLGRAAFL